MPRDRERSRTRDRRSSSYSSESSYERKKLKNKHKRRSRSKNRSQMNTHRRRRSTSRSRHRRRSYSRSGSRERYERSKRRSSSRSRSKRSKYSRERSHSRFSSGDRKYSRNTHKHSRSKSRSNSFDIEPRVQKFNLDDIDTKVEKAIKAAEAAGLTMTKITTYDYKDVAVKEEMPTIHDRNLLDELNSDVFVQKSFSSTRSKKQNNIIDLNAETVKLQQTEVQVKKDDSIINFGMIQCQEDLKEMWIKKLYQYRKKMIKGEIS